MPSRQPPPQNHHDKHLIAPLIAAAISVSVLAAIAYLYRKLTLTLSRRTAPAPLSTPDRPTSPPSPLPPKELRRFKYSRLKKATGGFGELSRIGQGGFGSVYRAVLPREASGVFAVKVMDATAGSIQGEREFHNEISLATRVISATAAFGYPHLVSVVGYSTMERHHERKLIVYEYMSNGSLQEKLLDSKCPELCIWEKRLKIIIHVAKALQFLHFDCGNTPVVHGDVKPSNVLLDDCFNAKLGDFGLARILDDTEDAKLDEIKVLHPDDVNLCNHDEIEEGSGYNAGSNNVNNDVGSIVEEESVSVITAEPSPVVGEVAVSPSEGFERESSLADSWGDKMSLESGKKKGSGRDYWWWKQGDDSSSGRVKDYVMEWIGSEIKKERPKSSDLLVVTSSINCNDGKIELKKKNKKRLQRWWSGPLNDEDKLRKKGRKPREWWKEEFCEELSKKNKKSKSKLTSKSSIGSEKWWQRDEEFEAPETKKRRKRNISFGSIDWWLDGLSGELRSGGIGRRNSQDWAASGCDIPKSGGISSTPSMRGTMCYIAPEYGGGGQLSEKCDVYSFGVLVLVVISGRRPLQVLASPMSEFERANLVSWARQLAYNGKLLDLVDSSIQSLDKEQAMLCITIALQCLQRSPSKRPNMKEILQMLMGEMEPPHLPFEFSPSPPSNFPFKSRKKGR